jgi:hypothetical protein
VAVAAVVAKTLADELVGAHRDIDGLVRERGPGGRRFDTP